MSTCNGLALITNKVQKRWNRDHLDVLGYYSSNSGLNYSATSTPLGVSKYMFPSFST